MNEQDFDLCNQAHRALTADLRRTLRGYAHGNDVDALALARLDFDGEPLDVNGSHAEMLPDFLAPLVDRRSDVREWAPKAPPRSGGVMHEIVMRRRA